MMNVLAIIPARGGSKRLPGKNIKILNGKPLICWTIEAALDASCIDEVIVSTDDENIADISRHCGANVPFIRPDELAADDTKTIDVILHTLNYCKNVSLNYDYVFVLQPTSPLRTNQHIEEAYELLQQKNADEIISVCPVDHPPEWTNVIDETLSLDNFLTAKDRRSQDFPSYFRLNGAIYLLKVESLLKEKSSFLSGNVFSYKMNKFESVDIDDEFDFLLAENIMRMKGK